MSVDASNATATAGVDPARARIAGAIKQAATTTGTSFEYLLATAKMESDFNPTASASTSSARGLFQFIDQTWLGTVKEAGAQLGYGNYADAITKSSSGTYSVSDPAARERDPETARRSRRQLRDGGRADPVQQFQAHRQDRPPPDRQRTLYGAFHGRRRRRQADRAMPRTIRRPPARGCFRTPPPPTARSSTIASGRARSVSEVYSVLTQRYASAANSPATRTAMASVGRDAGEQRGRGRSHAGRQRGLSVELSGCAIGHAGQRHRRDDRPASLRQPGQPMFRSLFQAGERAQPVSPAVQELWGNSVRRSDLGAATAVIAAGPQCRAPQPLDLFSDRNGTFSSG